MNFDGGVTPSAVESAIKTGTRMKGNSPNTTEFMDKQNGISVVTNSTGDVVTVKTIGRYW